MSVILHSISFIVIPIIIIAFFMYMVFDMIDNAIENIELDPVFCMEVYDRPEDFRPEDATTDEKYDYCVDFITNDAPGFKSGLESMRLFIWFIPVGAVVIVLFGLYQFGIFSKEDIGKGPSRKEYDPDFKGYGK